MRWECDWESLPLHPPVADYEDALRVPIDVIWKSVSPAIGLCLVGIEITHEQYTEALFRRDTY
jgi:hypothetical protein